MGYRFTLESANTVANLTFGKVMSCYRDIYSSQESYNRFMSFLDQFQENMYSNEKDRYKRSIRDIRERMYRDNHKWEENRRTPEECVYDDTFLHFHRPVLGALYELSTIFERCAVKSLLLPKMYTANECNGYADEFMLSWDTFCKLIRVHEGDSCLILQPQERPQSAIIFDAFPNFEVAIRQADLWPAVMFWDKYDDYAFVPIKYEDELYNLYEIIRYERRPINEFKWIAEKRRKPSHYIFQLSDIHFGAKNVKKAERRLKSLIKSQLWDIKDDDIISFVITGDVVDSPTSNTEEDYINFSYFLKEHSGTQPIRILGNHDINNHGLAFFHGNQRLAHIVGAYPKIEVLNEHKVILLLFNSNTNGNFAEGEIGTAQMAEMGNLLDDIKDLNDYLLIAVMHHHLLPIPQPDYYEEKWYKKILPGNFAEESLRLIDADLFMEWLIQRNVKFVLHGHKHIPFMAKKNGILVISCGSSTGQITHKERGKTYLSYNIIKISDRAVTCTQFAEEIIGAGAKNIRAETVRFD